MSAKRNLLIVDENPHIAGILVETLQKDFNVTIANTGEEAKRLLMQGTWFDCIITELNLTGFDGLQLTKFIRASRFYSQTPVIVLSDASDSDTRIQCLDQGVDSYIAKPFNPLEVKSRVRALLRRFSVSAEELESRLKPAQFAPANNPARQFKSRLLSMFQREYAVS